MNIFCQGWYFYFLQKHAELTQVVEVWIPLAMRIYLHEYSRCLGELLKKRSRNSCIVFLQHISFSQTSKYISIIWWKYRKCLTMHIFLYSFILHQAHDSYQWYFSSETVDGGNWKYFSAVCWFYGKNLYDQLKRPIGLIATDWGGTPIEAWSSPDALQKCNITGDKVDHL